MWLWRSLGEGRGRDEAPSVCVAVESRGRAVGRSGRGEKMLLPNHLSQRGSTAEPMLLAWGRLVGCTLEHQGLFQGHLLALGSNQVIMR